jgi:hypothetical protein
LIGKAADHVNTALRMGLARAVRGIAGRNAITRFERSFALEAARAYWMRRAKRGNVWGNRSRLNQRGSHHGSFRFTKLLDTMTLAAEAARFFCCGSGLLRFVRNDDLLERGVTFTLATSS